MSDEYTCAMCGGTFTKALTDEEARQEYSQIFEPLGFAPPDTEELEIVCDVCWQEIKPPDAHT